MDVQDFYDEIVKLGKFFNKTLNSEQQDTWYREVGGFPAVAIKSIFADLKNEGGSMPAINKVRAMYYNWLSNNPSFKAKVERQACPECDGQGYFEAWAQGKTLKGFIIETRTGPEVVEMWYRRELPCALCENWRLAFPTKGEHVPKRRWTKGDAVECGFKLHDPEIPNKKVERKYGTVAQAVEASTKRM